MISTWGDAFEPQEYNISSVDDVIDLYSDGFISVEEGRNLIDQL